MKSFSKKYKTFEQWHSLHRAQTAYNKRIVRLHMLHPTARLNALAGHSGGKAGALSRHKAKPIYTRSWDSLSVKEKRTRELALQVVSQARRTGKSLSYLSRLNRISSKTVRHATNCFKKVKGSYKVFKSDRISRMMLIAENKREHYIEINDSREASIVGHYWQDAIKEYLTNGNAIPLSEFRGRQIKDAQGNLHTLETNINSIIEIQERSSGSRRNCIHTFQEQCDWAVQQNQWQ